MSIQGPIESSTGGGSLTSKPARTPLRELVSTPAGTRVRVSGWVDVVRDQKAVQFVVLAERDARVQATIVRAAHPAVATVVSQLSPGYVVEFQGELVRNDRVKLGGIELLIDTVDVLASAEPIPIDASSGPEARQNYRFIELRRDDRRLIFDVQTAIEHAMRCFWIEEGLMEIQTPKLMGSPSESGAEVFEVAYFDRKAYLAQSPQFYKQMAIAAGFGSVFEICPVFRAEPSFTTRHATEFTSVDVELGFIDGVEDVMAFEERWIASVLGSVAATHGDAIRRTFGVDIVVPELPFPRITMAEAGDLLGAAGHSLTPKGDLDPTGERELSRVVRERDGHEFVFVTGWPKTVRPFYHMRDGDLTRSFDLLWKGVEITTGAQREHRFDVLKAQAEEAGVGSSVDYYLDFFRYGCPPHGGWGFGLARFLMILLGQQSIRDTTFLFRGPNRLTP